MTFEQETVLMKALNTYGIENQTLMLAEETSELVKACTKMCRSSNLKCDELRDNLIEEIADVRIMIKQMCMYYRVQEEEIEKVMDMKISRLSKNLNAKQG